MKEMVKELIVYRNLLFMLIWRDIKVKYKQSIMGFMWAILMPTLTIVAGILVKKAFSIFSGKPMDLAQIASVSVKSLPWTFLVGTSRFATNSLTNNANLVTKIYFPREVFPLSSVFSNLFDFLIAGSVLVPILTIAGLGWSIHLLWLPLFLFFLVSLVAGIGMLVACANLFFRDVKYIVEVFLTIGIFFTPVFYEAEIFGRWSSIILLNPIAVILESINRVTVIHQPPNIGAVIYSASWSVFGLIIAWYIFHRLEFIFAENI